MKKRKKLRAGMRVMLKSGIKGIIWAEPPAVIGNKRSPMPHGPIVLEGYVYVTIPPKNNVIYLEKIDDLSY